METGQDRLYSPLETRAIRLLQLSLCGTQPSPRITRTELPTITLMDSISRTQLFRQVAHGRCIRRIRLETIREPILRTSIPKAARPQIRKVRPSLPSPALALQD